MLKPAAVHPLRLSDQREEEKRQENILSLARFKFKFARYSFKSDRECWKVCFAYARQQYRPFVGAEIA